MPISTDPISLIKQDADYQKYLTCLACQNLKEVTDLRTGLITVYTLENLRKALLDHLEAICTCLMSEDSKTIQEDNDTDPVKIIIAELEILDTPSDDIRSVTDSMLNEIKFSIKA